MEPNGNLVKSNGDTSDNGVITKTNTEGNPGASLRLTQDGTLEVVRPGPDFRVIWSSYTAGKGATHAVIQDDGNFVLYDSNANPVWNWGGC